MSFRPGWYEIRFDAKTFRKTCRYFKSTTVYVAECYLEPNGQQILLWQDPQFLSGPGRPAAWQHDYRELPTAPTGDWWDNPPGGARGGASSPGAFDRAARQPSALELTQRAATVDRSLCGLDCIKEINVGIFFDGTNNNLYRDEADNSQSNIVSLFNAHKPDRSDNFRYYIPGVGTKFPEIGENSEDPSGKKYAAGGEARIHYAMLHVFNAVCRASTQMDLATEAEMRQIVTSTGAEGLSTWWRLSDAKMVSFFERLNARLLKAVEGKRPKVVKVHVSIFGFSRGAAQARVFANWLQLATGGQVGHAALTIKFLGIFDTVASVFLADSSPVGSGFFDWADGNLGIAGVASTEHFVASHEIRLSFPLSTARAGGAYPSNTKERAYPGAHSDVGGGYAPGDQGKGKSGRAAMVSQIPLNDMHFSALNAGAALMKADEMPREVKEEFAVDSKLNAAFDAYAQWTDFDDKENFAATGQRAENRLMDHMHLYWRWRASVSDDTAFKSLQSYAASKPQDRIDLWESELDWRTDIERAREASKPRTVRTGRGGTATIAPNPSPAQRQLLVEITRGATVPAGAAQLFDQFVHDSHAGFWMLGPQTLEDRRAFIKVIKEKKARYDELMALANQTPDFQAMYNYESLARAYELNNFERRVLAADAAVPDSMPPMSDADAPNMRANAGWVTSVALTTLVGTNSRREPHGHGRYRRVFDRS
jgi:uncharacterized protein (DUF2235 family)